MSTQVEVEVDSMDKAGNFIGWLFIENRNLSVALVQVCSTNVSNEDFSNDQLQAGLASVHFTADRSKYAKELYSNEDAAKAKKEKVLEFGYENYNCVM